LVRLRAAMEVRRFWAVEYLSDVDVIIVDPMARRLSCTNMPRAKDRRVDRDKAN
jgi:hypothetical protein